MSKKYFVTALLALLFCFNVHGETKAKSKGPDKVVTGFTVISKEEVKAKVVCQNIEMPKGSMPRVRTQSDFPLCQSYAPATVLQFQYCKRKKIPNCSQVPLEQEVSPLSVSNLIHEDGRESFSPKTIRMYTNNGDASEALINAARTFVFHPESCYPMDKFINKYGDASDAKMKEIIAKLKTELKKAKTEGAICDSCLNSALMDLGSTAPIADIKTKLVEYYAKNKQNEIDKKNKVEKDVWDWKTPDNVLYDLMLADCKEESVDLRPSQTPKVDYFPKEEDPASYDREKMISKVEEVLATGNPLTFGGVCQNYEDGRCKYTLNKEEHSGLHVVVIHGYTKLCDNDKCDSGCRRAFHIQNSWGEDWQRDNNDGLVDAEDLLSYVAYTKDDNKYKNDKRFSSSKERMEKVLTWMY